MSGNRPEEPASSPEPWYGNGLRFRCTQCGQCCTGAPGVVWVNEEEIGAIADYLGTSEGEIRLLHTRLYPGGVSLTEFANGDCTFLDPQTRRCRIYPVRPRQCRTWPFWNSNLQDETAWQEAADTCPGINQGELYTLAEIEQQAAVIDI